MENQQPPKFGVELFDKNR